MEGRKLKVLQLGKQYYPHIGGIEITMQQIAEGLQGQIESYVLASQERHAARTEIIHGVPVYFAGSLGIIASMPVSFDMIRYLKKHANEFDIIHLHMPFPLGDLACLLSGFKGKLVVYWHSDVVRQKKAMLLYRPLMNWTLKRADAIAIATQGNIDGSPYVKPYEQKCHRIPFGLRREWEKKSDLYWQMVTSEKEKPEAADETALRLLFIGRLVYYKGCDVLIEALEKLKSCTDQKEFSGIHLQIVGEGILREELEKEADKEQLKENITFCGRVSDEELEKQIENCDVFVFPSVANSEAFGLVQLETMAYGKPVINTSLPTGVPWVSIHGETGLTVEPRNAEELAKAILWMKRHPKERREMGKRARERVKTRFTQDKMLADILNLYRELCEE